MKREDRIPSEITIVDRGTAVKVKIRKPLDSSNVDWVGWPVTGEPAMIVQFKGGGRYVYLGAPRQRVVAAAYADSVGKYLNTVIKPKYKCVKIS